MGSTDSVSAGTAVPVGWVTNHSSGLDRCLDTPSPGAAAQQQRTVGRWSELMKRQQRRGRGSEGRVVNTVCMHIYSTKLRVLVRLAVRGE